MKNIIISLNVLIVFCFSCSNQNTKNSNKKVLIVVTSNDQLADGSPAGYYLPEVIDFYHVLNRFNIEATIASPKGGMAPMYSRKFYLQNTRYQTQLLKTGLLELLDNTVKIKDIDPEDYDAIYFVGGFACLFDFPNNKKLASIGADIYDNNGIVAAVCHGPSALLNIKLSNGEYLIANKTVTSRTIEEDTRGGEITKKTVLTQFPFLIEQALIEKGAKYTKANRGAPHFVVYERLVTGQGPSATKNVAISVVELINEMDILSIQEFSKVIEEKGIQEALIQYKDHKLSAKNAILISENEINNLGYDLLSADKLSEAIEVFKLNVNEFPESANVYDSMGEAYLKSGNTDSAIINYEKSLKLNPDNINAKKIIIDLKLNKAS